MFFIFKLLFAYFGAAIAPYFRSNPVFGLLIGGVVGHILDQAATLKYHRWKLERIYRKRAQREFNQAFLSNLFLMLAKLCAADGVISKAEISYVEHLMEKVFSFDRITRKQAVEIFRGARSNPQSFQSCAARLCDLYQNLPQMLENLLQMLFSLATADGVLNPEEEKLIHSAAMVFGFDEQRYQNMKVNFSFHQERPNDVSRSYSILGCRPEDSVADIKRSYRKLVSEFHPDKIVAKELPEEFIKFAHEKFKTIQQAYDSVKEARGFS